MEDKRTPRGWLRQALAVAFIAAAVPAYGKVALEPGSLDGSWCSPGSETITLRGLDVVTPDGLETKGRYTKHAFRFTDPRSGKEYWLEPKGENALRVSIVSEGLKEPPPHDRWQRCVTTS